MATKDFVILQGKTFNPVLRWESAEVVYKTITNILNTAPVRITATAHGVPDGWRCAVVGVKGMTELNAESSPPKPKDYWQATVVDANTVEFNRVNATGFKPYSSGGVLQFNKPVDLTGATARMVVKDKVGGTTLLTLTTANGGVEIDTVTNTVRLNVSATDTGSIAWKKGVYEIEVEQSGEVRSLLTGNITVQKEIAS